MVFQRGLLLSQQLAYCVAPLSLCQVSGLRTRLPLTSEKPQGSQAAKQRPGKEPAVPSSMSAFETAAGLLCMSAPQMTEMLSYWSRLWWTVVLGASSNCMNISEDNCQFSEWRSTEGLVP